MDTEIPLYRNSGYAWSNQFTPDPPKIETVNNHVGSYRKTVEIPASWKGQQVFLHVGSATSNLYVWVNGKFVGYSEDSKLAAEFDITGYVRPGKNLIAMQVYRWCDGSYLEDQDFLAFIRNCPGSLVVCPESVTSEGYFYHSRFG